MATGCLSAPLEPQIPGRESFEGISLFTNAWPHDPPDLTGKRVGLVGTGSSGVQATPELARDAAELYVFQRTPSYAWPAGNKPLDADLQVKVKEQYRELRAEQRRNYGGVVGTSGAVAVPLPRDVAILEATPEERLAAVDELGWAACRAWSDVLRDLDANEAGAELYREMVRRVIDDPETADGLSPRAAADRVQATDPAHRLLRDVQPRPRAPGRPPARWHRGDHARPASAPSRASSTLDVIVFATGFDAMTGALVRIDIRGRDGLPLRDAWADGARTLLGIQTAGFPNLFTITGPGSPSVLANMVVCAEQHIEWIGELLTYMREHGHTAVDADAGGAGRLGRRGEPGRHRHDVHRAHVQLLVPRRQHPGQGARLPARGSAGCPATSSTATRIVAAGYEGFEFSMTRTDRSRRTTSTCSARSRAPTPTRRGSSRASSCPVAWSERHGGFWVISGYDQVAAAFRDWEHFSSARTDPEISSIVLGAEPPAAADTRGDRPARLVPGAPGPVGAAGAAGRRAVASTRPALDHALRRPVHRSGGVRVHPPAVGAGPRRGHARVARVPRRRLAHDHRRVPQRRRVLARHARSTAPRRPSSAT